MIDTTLGLYMENSCNTHWILGRDGVHYIRLLEKYYWLREMRLRHGISPIEYKVFLGNWINLLDKYIQKYFAFKLNWHWMIKRYA